MSDQKTEPETSREFKEFANDLSIKLLKESKEFAHDTVVHDIDLTFSNGTMILLQ